MARPSHISRLPPEVREGIGQRRENGQTLDEILEWLLDQGFVQVSRSSLGRYVQNEDRLFERLRRSRVMADAVIRNDVDAQPDKLARLNHNLMHTAIFDLFTALEDDDNEAIKELFKNPKTLEQISRALASLSSSAKTDAEYRRQVREEVEREVQAQAKKNIQANARKSGLSTETVDALMSGAFGVQK